MKNNNSKTLKEKLQTNFKDLQVQISEDTQVVITAESEQIAAVLEFLKGEKYDHFTLLSAVDWIEDNAFELCYILTSYEQNDNEPNKNKLHIILKTKIPREEPEFGTITGIFPAAEPYEREIHELFGINFQGHSRLIPLLLEREYEIPPFRKDFDTRKYVEDVFDKIPFVENKDE